MHIALLLQNVWGLTWLHSVIDKPWPKWFLKTCHLIQFIVAIGKEEHGTNIWLKEAHTTNISKHEYY